MRAPGHPQGIFGLDQTMDALAEKLSMDVLEVMDKNDRQSGAAAGATHWRGEDLDGRSNAARRAAIPAR